MFLQLHLLLVLTAAASGNAQNPRPASAQNEASRSVVPPNPPATREDAIEDERQQRIANLEPDLPSKPERLFNSLQKNEIWERVFGDAAGWRVKIGGMISGSGFSLGPEYYRPDLLNGNMVVRASALASFEQYELLDLLVSFPHLLRDRAFLDSYDYYFNYPSLDYYGPGPNSKKTGRSEYRLENTAFDVRGGFRPFSHLRLGVTGGLLAVNVGPGIQEQYISTDQQYTEATTPGIDRQSTFLRGGPFMQFDYRDRPDDPHSGGNYEASYTYYDDRQLDISNFRLLRADAQQYIPFFNKKRVIALRARTELSYRNTNQIVPFYLQPTLGGADDLRGFRQFRYYDNNSMLMSAEYRWEVMTPLDMAVFVDSGKVFHRHADLNFADLETDAGFGLRFKTRDAVFMRWDVGFSREGFQVWVKFNNIFSSGRFGSPSLH